jgi:gamma-glutamylputrescine oxidase
MHTTPLPTWYHARAAEPPLDLPPLEGRRATRVAVVGGGLAGLAAALSLAERGVEAVLLEAGRIGDGASGRNGGMVSAGFTRGTGDLVPLIGLEGARALHRLSREAMDLVRARVARHAVACDLVQGVFVASWFDGFPRLQVEAELLNRTFGMRLEPWPEERVRAVYRTERYTGGAFDPDGFHLDPLALCRGYARAALARGAFLFEASPALRLEGGEGRVRLCTPCGVVEAETVVLATSAYGDAILPELRRAILPVASYVVVTEPLGRRLEEVVGAPWAVYDDRFAVGYYRPLPEGRLLWGGRVSLRDDPPDLARLMRRDLARVYPQLAKVRIEHAWPGRMGFARHKMPVVRPLGPGVWATTAYGGHGLNTTTMGGELVAAAIAEGDDRWRLLAPFAPVPVFGRLGRLAAQGIYWGRAAGDVLRAARLRRRTR